MRSFPHAPVLLLAALGATACSAAPENATDEPDPALGKSVAAITASDAIARAEEWVTAKLLYCQSPNGADDTIDPSCPPVCMRESNPAWDPYRSDCSGLVSWAWDLPAPGRTTAEFAPNMDDITSAIDASTLAMGDAVNTDDSTSSEHHIMLFKEWTVAGEAAPFIEEPGCSATPDYAHEFTSTVTLSGTSITVAYNGITFTAIHYASLTQGGSSTTSSGGGGTTYAASYVSQSWPLSSDPPIAMTVGQMQKGSIDMMNTGNATWKAGVVKLAPIPRDTASDVHASTWLSTTRVSTLAADVAPGATGHFEWDLDPSQTGNVQPYFGLVAEGITWFADSGGPPDNDIQVNIDAKLPPPATASSSSSTGGSSTGGSSGTGTSTSHAGGAGGAGGSGSGEASSCQLEPGPAPASAAGLLAGLAGLLLARRRRGVRPACGSGRALP
jgi:uncharacterized membrane protein YgcG